MISRGSLEGDTRFLDPAIAASVGNLELVARFVVEGFLLGLHRSPYHGFSAEFASYREYSPGDDPRYLDWKVLGRTDRLYLKQFEESTNTICQFLLDCSGSMAVGAGVSKFTYARQLVAALAYLVLKQKDAAGMLAFADGPMASLPPRRAGYHLARIAAELARLEPSRTTAVAKGLAGLPEKLRRRSLVALVSDCLADPEEILETLRLFRARGHEVIVFQVLSPEEKDFPFRDLVEFVDAETGERLLAQASDVRASYMEGLLSHEELLRRECGEMGVDFVELRTDTRLDRALVDYLAKRRRSSALL